MYLNIFLNAILVISIAAYDKTYNSCNDFKLLNGRMRIKPRGKLAKFQCNKDYMLAGEKYSYCIKGKFDVPPPVCVKPTCVKYKEFTNGLILPSYNGAVMNFYCNPGFVMRGSNISYCDGSKWSHNLPLCLSTHMALQTSCDFETEDLCGWSHDINHDFDWRRQNFQTPSGHIGTGPMNDHTKGPKKNGYYMYIESTSRLENDVARLISPLFPAYRNGLCFTFWYHMYGRDMGRLNVYIRSESKQGQGTIPRGTKPHWTKQGNLGDVWRKGRIVLEDGISENFQIIIEGIRGSSYISDIAIDDVELLENCPEDEISSSTTEFSTETEPDLQFGSCVDRCIENSTEIVFGDSASCECNENCYERNTCCPDYTIVCLQMAFEEISTDSTENYETTTEIEPEMTTLSTLPVFNTTENNIETTITLVATTKKPKYIPVIQTIPTIKPIVYSKPPTTLSTVAPTAKTSTKLVTNPTTKPPKAYIGPKTKSTLKIDKKIEATTQSTTMLLTTNQKTLTTEITSPKPSDIDYPNVEDNSIEVETDYEFSTEKIILENPAILMQKNQIEQGNSMMIFLIGGSSAVLLISVIIVSIIFVKYNNRCTRIRNSRNSDSMSDVRFLASDEVLDFTWRSSSDM